MLPLPSDDDVDDIVVRSSSDDADDTVVRSSDEDAEDTVVRSSDDIVVVAVVVEVETEVGLTSSLSIVEYDLNHILLHQRHPFPQHS